MKARYLKVILLSLGATLAACGGGSGGDSDNDSSAVVTPTLTRGFQMGFTPWPYDATLDALNNTYTLIQQNGDIVAHHITEGVPWEAALNRTAYPAHLTREIDGRVSQTLGDKTVYLAIDSLSILRETLIGNWGESGQESRTPPWDSRSFADPEVIAAFSNFSLDMIARFEPAYFNYATEANELYNRNPAAFDDFVVFARGVYNNIKAQYPALPVMVSIALKSPAAAETSEFAGQFARIADYVDLVGISVYPYAFYNAQEGASPDTLPTDWLSQISVIAPNKPVAITETGWVAEDLLLPRFAIDIRSDDATQRNYVERTLDEAERLDARFVIWFTAVDFDALWNTVLGQYDLPAIWRDAGLYDETLRPRAALDVWQAWFDRPLRAQQ